MIENDPTILGEGETIENHKEKWPNLEKQLMTLRTWEIMAEQTDSRGGAKKK